jgi:glucose/arabinose dehydrogenase
MGKLQDIPTNTPASRCRPGLRALAWALTLAGVMVASVAGAADPLLSRNKPTKASSSGGCCPPQGAVDGNSATRWASGAGIDPSWIYVDLGVTAQISRVRLQWDLSCATEYRVETSDNASAWTSIFSTTTGDGGVDDLAITGSGRFVRMFGIHRCRTDASKGYSLQEFEVFGTTGPADTTPPSVPQNPRASNLTCNSVTFAWDAASDNVGVTAYDIFHDGQLIKSVGGSTLSTSFAVMENVTWGLYVNARDAAGNVSQASTTVPITPPPCQVDHQPPTAPTNLKGTVSGTSVALSWGASSDNIGVRFYDVTRSGTPAGTVAGSPPGTNFNDAGLAPNTTFDYVVAARDAQGNVSPESNTLTVTTGSGCTNPVCKTTTITTDTDIPWGLVTLPDGTLLYTRRDAHNITHLNPKTGSKTVIGSVPNVQSTDGEGGLMGLEINPASFSSDHWLYIMHTSSSDNRIVRIKFENNQLMTASEQVLFTGIKRNKFHNGGRIRFSPDGKFLFVATGDAQNGDNAQNKSSLNGKVLRLHPDGTIPTDNPFGNAVWSYGHRNPQGLAFDSQGRLWEQEFGNSVMDETNLIQKGGNYGWPACEGTSGSCGGSGFIAPKHTYSVSSGSCSGITIVRDVLYVACERGTRMFREVISGSSLTNVQTFFQGTFGRLRTVEPAPDGGLWLTTSNGDKDSTPNNSDTKVIHVELGH